jgi:hypothetical protein
MGKPHLLKGLVVDEVSLVDAPANPGAIHLLFKRKDATMPTDAERAAIAAKKAKIDTTGALDRLLTRLGIGKRADPATIDPDTYADAASAAIDKACEALTTSIASIMADASVTDKAPPIAKSLAEFRSFTADATGDQIEKAMRDVALIKSGKDDSAMPTEAEQIATLTKQVADMQAEIDKAKMSPKHAKFMAGLGSDDAKGKFAAKSPADRDAQCDAGGDDVGKGDTVALTKAQGEIAALQKSIAGFEAERELEAFRKRASTAGVGDGQAEVLMKASKGDPDAFGKVLEMLKSATTAAKTGAIFKEFGGSGGTGATGGGAAEEIAAQAQVLMKADPKLGLIAARVAVRKGNLELAQRERDEERAAVRAVS